MMEVLLCGLLSRCCLAGERKKEALERDAKKKGDTGKEASGTSFVQDPGNRRRNRNGITDISKSNPERKIGPASEANTLAETEHGSETRGSVRRWPSWALPRIGSYSIALT